MRGSSESLEYGGLGRGGGIGKGGWSDQGNAMESSEQFYQGVDCV